VLPDGRHDVHGRDRTHLNILRKLGCRDRVARTALAYETRLITPGESE